MEQESSIRIAEWLLITAAVAGPILAVQAQKWVERLTEARKLWIFYTLMATRAARTAPEHVQALNAIDLAFRSDKPTEKAIREAWGLYLDHLCALEDTKELSELRPEERARKESELTVWVNRSDELFTELLYVLSNALGYKFSKVQIKRGIYTPRAHGQADFEQRFIRSGIVRVLSGELPIPMVVRYFPYSEDAANLQKEVNQALLKSLSDKRIVKVSIVNNDEKATVEHQTK